MHLSVDKCSSLVEDKTMHCDPPDLLLDNFSLERVEYFKCLEILLNHSHGQITLHLFVPKVVSCYRVSLLQIL